VNYDRTQVAPELDANSEKLSVNWTDNLCEYCFVTVIGDGNVDVIYNATLNSDPGINVPKDYKYIEQTGNKTGWLKAVTTELNNLMKRQVISEKQKLPPGKKALSTRWIFKWKTDPANEKQKFEKARLVVKGYEQIPGVDFTETFSPVASDAAIRTILAISLYQASLIEGWTMDIVDVETAFLNAKLDEEIYIRVPDGFAEFKGEKFDPGEVLRLNRALYGLVQSPRAWLKHFVSVLEDCGLTACQSEPCVLYQRENGKLILLVVIYVDNCILAGHKLDVLELKSKIKKRLVISDLGQLSKHLGVHYKFGKDSYGPYLAASMQAFCDEIVSDCEKLCGNLRDFPTPGYGNVCLMKHLGEPLMQKEYRSIVGKILYLVKKVEPTCANAVCELSSFLDGPSQEHWKSIARVAGYLSKHSKALK
jgi:hypothetical protein